MQSLRINNRLPRVIRVLQTPTTTTSYNTTRKMSLFPRYIANEFAPMFRLMDDYAQHRSGSLGNDFPSFNSTFKSFTPKFDVKENKESYELHGELPGIKQENINIEFTDAQTLTIKGRTEHVREEGERPAGLIEGEQKKQIEGNGYHKPSVEEEGSKQATETQVQTASEEAKQPEKQSRYWVSERSVGEFARTFSFPTRVDQENVKASLKDGVLSIVVPKAQAPTSKKINIE